MATTYPNTNLQPGMSGPEVKKLQEWLIYMGYGGIIKAGATGYYGDQTKAAVAQLQQNLGVDTAGYAGYWGPKTLQAVSQMPANKSTTKTSSTQKPSNQISVFESKPYSSGTTTQSTAKTSPEPQNGVSQPVSGQSSGTTSQTQNNTQNQQITQTTQTQQTTQTPTKPEGMPDDAWNLMSESEKSYFSPIWSYLSKNLEAGKTIPVTLTTAELDKLYQEAKADPVIQKYYQDQLAIGESNLKFNLADLEQQRQLTATKQTEETKELSEAEAAAGRAYSGFREQAKQRLSETHKGVIESSKRTLQKLGLEAEQALGTTAVNKLGIAGYNPLGNIGGQLETQKLADTEQKYQSLINKALQQKGATT